ncbi:9820_t:CDS:2, partial [Gigaspora margarita]
EIIACLIDMAMFNLPMDYKIEEKIVFFKSKKWDSNKDKIRYNHNKLDLVSILCKYLEINGLIKESEIKYYLLVIKTKIPLDNESFEEVKEFVHALLILQEHAESTRQSQTKNTELKDITLQKNTNIFQLSALTIETHPDEENSTSSIDLKQQSLESQIPGLVKLKSLKEKEIDEFIDLKNKKKVNNIIRQRNRKIFQDKNTSLDNISLSAQNVPKKYIKDSSLVTRIVQGLLQKFLVNSIEDNIKFINSEPLDSPSSTVELAHLLYQ